MNKKAEKTYSELKSELDEIMSNMQNDELDVEQMTKQYERGMEIIKQLESHLKSAENKVHKIKKSFESGI